MWMSRLTKIRPAKWLARLPVCLRDRHWQGHDVQNSQPPLSRSAPTGWAGCTVSSKSGYVKPTGNPARHRGIGIRSLRLRTRTCSICHGWERPALQVALRTCSSTGFAVPTELWPHRDHLSQDRPHEQRLLTTPQFLQLRHLAEPHL